jgi:hypothetical protein
MRKQRFKLGEPVYLITGNDKAQRIITQISYYPGGRKYELSCGLDTSWHYDLEFTRELSGRTTIRGLGKYEGSSNK